MSSSGKKSVNSKFSIPIDLVPCRAALQGFISKAFAGDISAAVNVGLLAFPQGMAYALIAGIPLHYGIFGSAVAAFFCTLFAKSHFITLGPTNATSVLLLSAFAALQIGDDQKLQLLPLIVFLSGVFLVIGALGKVATLIQYISKSVITGYITAAAILIIANQFKNAVGIHFNPEVKASTFFEVLYFTGVYIERFRWSAVLISGLTAAIFWSLSRYFQKLPNVAISLLVISLLTVILEGWGISVDKLQSISMGEWRFTPPSWDFHQIRLLIGTALAISILSLLEGSSIGKTLAARSGGKLDANQEMFNMGIANLGCAFFSGMPASGSLTRSMLNWKSGAKSPMANFYTGLFIVLAAFILGPFISYVPKPALAVLVISIGISLINGHQIFVVTHSTGSDKLVFYLTLSAGLCMPLDMAIVIGTGLSIFLFLKKAAIPELVEYTFNEDGHLLQRQNQERKVLEISIVHVEGDLFFGSADLFRDQIRRVFEVENLKILVLRMKNAHILDATCVLALEELMNYMKENDRFLLISGVREKIYQVLLDSGIIETLGQENVFKEDPENPTFSTALAMRRAQQILGGREANVTIYVNPDTHKGPNAA